MGVRLFRPAGYDVRLDRGETLDDLAHSFAALTHGVLHRGNAAQVIQNGLFFDALLEDVSAATSSIHLENYLWKPGEVFDRVVDGLSKKAREGLEVRVIYDWIGAREVRDGMRQLQAAGCRVVRHRASRLRDLRRINRRDHRKLVVIDAKISYVFGHGLSDDWREAVPSDRQWRDTAVRLRGPIVNQLQSVFLEKWTQLTAEAVAGPRYVPEQPRMGDVAAHVAYVSPSGWRSAVRRLYYLAIQAANRRLLIQNPYFLPDRIALGHFRDAVARGVEVKVMLPAVHQIDFPIVQHASHHFFGSLLEAGAVILEYTRSGLHQKVMIVDDQWSCVGSTNFDPRSFRRNDEVSVGMFDGTVARTLTEAFFEDERHCESWTIGRWKSRPRAHQAKDFGAALLRGHL